MKDNQIEVTFSETEYRLIERYSKKNRVHINEVIRLNLAEWLQKLELSDTNVYLR